MASLSQLLPLSKCNHNGHLALYVEGEKNYDLKRPSTVQGFVPLVGKESRKDIWRSHHLAV